MTFRPPAQATRDGRSAIDVFDGAHHAATIYCTLAGVHVVCSDPYAAEIDTDRTAHPNVHIELRRPAE